MTTTTSSLRSIRQDLDGFARRLRTLAEKLTDEPRSTILRIIADSAVVSADFPAFARRLRADEERQPGALPRNVIGLLANIANHCCDLDRFAFLTVGVVERMEAEKPNVSGYPDEMNKMWRMVGEQARAVVDDRRFHEELEAMAMKIEMTGPDLSF